MECCNGFDVNHEDFVNTDGTNQILTIDNSVNTSPSSSHGTAVAGLAAGTTDNATGWSSIGFNCKLMLYTGGYNKIWQAALDGAKVINNSWYAECGAINTSNQMTIDLVHDMGVVIIAGAGNGNQNNGGNACDGGPSIGGSVGGVYQNGLAFPASANHVISVSSVDLFDTYAGPGSLFHTFNTAVDITAPGFNTQLLGNYNTYSSHGGWGTSFAAPMVAGVCGLILSVNPCLNPDDVEQILKQSADDVSGVGNNIDLAGYDGAGRVNAYQAVLLAQTYGSVSPITTNTTWNTDMTVSGNVTVESGATLTIKSKINFSENSKIVVKRGAKLIVNGGTLTSNCNMWKGIEVWGTSSQTQPSAPNSSNNTTHGYVKLINGAIISNARDGITTIKKDNNGNIDWNGSVKG